MDTSKKIVTRKEAIDRITHWQSESQKVVFTNGCFDLLHLGHADYLEKAKKLGDKLVVGLNTDNSVKRIKGENRPVNNEISRSRLLAALAFVDLVVLFDEDTPLSLIKALKPDILVKGNDYKKENIIGADFVMDIGGKVITLELIDGYSTTDLIEKIKKT